VNDHITKHDKFVEELG